MRIIPLSDLRNTKSISDMITLDKEPIFVTKQGAQHLVILPHEMYVDMQKKLKALNE